MSNGYSTEPAIATERTNIWRARRDLPGPAPSGDYVRRGGFEKVRKSLDRALQATREVVYVPQADEDVASYEARLLNDLRPHTESFKKFNALGRTAEFVDRFGPQIIREALDEPKRNNTLVEIKMHDPHGRAYSEFQGSMRSWMNAFRAEPSGEGVFINGQRQSIRLT